MANPEHLKIFKSGDKKWNKWRTENPNIQPDLSETDLREAYMTRFDYNEAARIHQIEITQTEESEVELSEDEPSEANLRGANLTGINLRGAALNFYDLSGADLSKADLSESDLNNSNLRGTNLKGANLTNANLTEVDLSGADLSQASLMGVNLSVSNLTKANLRGASLSSAYVYMADLTEADLREADLTEVDLGGTNLSEANMSGAELYRTVLTGSNLNGTVFFETNLDQTILGLTDLSNCKHLESVSVSGPCVIDFPTLRSSKNLPKEFLTKLGIPDLLMEYLPDFYDPALRIYPAFLSHSWADKVFVRKLYEALTQKGVTTWLDEKKMKPGDNIHDSIGDAIKYYDKLILVCSKNALNSWWVEKELERVFEKERELQKERGKKFRLVIPIMIDDSILGWKDGVAATVKSSVIGDFTKWQDETEFNKAVKELVDALNAARVDIKPPSLL